jgi:hypothetical protein
VLAPVTVVAVGAFAWLVTQPATTSTSRTRS